MSQINIGVFGLGRFGIALVKTLDDLRNERSIHLRVLDRDPKKVDSVESICEDPKTVDLEGDTNLKYHFESLDVAIIAMGENTLPVIQLANAAMEWNSEEKRCRVLCRAHDEKTEEILEKLGIPREDIFSPERTAAEHIGLKAIRPRHAEFPPLGPGQGLISIQTPDSWINKSLAKLNLRQDYEANLLCLIRAEKPDEVVTPKADTKPRKGDTLFLLGALKKLSQFQDL